VPIQGRQSGKEGRPDHLLFKIFPMSKTISKSVLRKVFGSFLLAVAMSCAAAYGQSTSQDYPTPVSTNELSGSIKARDIGDPRVTTYFYNFNGNQGDLFINVVTKNLNGNIDVFSAEGLRLLTRILVFADVADNETGRVVYLRKPERLILRVEGRTPNDDPATFQVKFAGSFQAVSGDNAPVEPKLPDIKAENTSGIQVNSAGAIIAVRPKPTPTEVARAEKVEDRTAAEEKRAEPVDETVKRATPEGNPEETKKTTVVVEDNIPKPTAEPKARRTTGKAPRRTAPAKKSTAKSRTEVAEKTEKETARNASPESTENAKKNEKAVDPLANVNLIVEFKDGRRVERPMSDVFRFTVDHGSITIIRKDGKIDRFPIVDVAKVSVE
jgi:hypothetical protein